MSEWIEIRAVAGDLQGIYEAALGQCSSIHHFHREPWHPNGVVVRVENPPAGLDGESWDASGDESLFGEAWPEVRAFFEAGSRMALIMESAPNPHWLRSKLIHCFLNSCGLTVADEVRFGARFTRGRIRMWLHDQLYEQVLTGKRCRYGCHPTGVLMAAKNPPAG